MAGPTYAILQDHPVWKLLVMITAIALPCCCALFLTAHITHTRLKGAFHLRRSSSLTQEFDVIILCAFALLFVGGGSVAFLLLEVDRNSEQCKGMYLYAALVYLAFNFLSYRLLMARGRMLDQMNEYTRVHDLLYWLVHTVFIAYAVCGMGLYSTAEFTIQPLKAGGRGRELCVLELSEGLSHTALLITLAVWDTGISLSILWLLTLSFRDTSSSLMPVLRRNIVGTSLAVCSTASFIVLITVMSVESDKNGGEGFLPGVAIAFAMHDVLINLLCINFIWPSTYYAKNLQRVFRKRCHDGSSKNNQNHSFSSRSVSRSREIRMMMNHVSGRVVSKTKKKSIPDMIAERRQQNAQRKRNSFSNPNSVTLVAAEEDELHQQKITLPPAVAIESGGGGGEMKEQQLWISSNNFQHVPSPPASHSLSKVAPLATCERSGSDATAGGIILSSSGNFNCGLQQSSNSHLKAAGGPQINHQNLDESVRSGIIDV